MTSPKYGITIKGLVCSGNLHPFHVTTMTICDKVCELAAVSVTFIGGSGGHRPAQWTPIFVVTEREIAAGKGRGRIYRIRQGRDWLQNHGNEGRKGKDEHYRPMAMI